jgi:hypothetical protein
MPQGEELVRDLGLEHGERVVFAPLPQAELRTLLVSGRLPEPGKPEALAGDLAARSTFIVDQVEFKIVGKLNRSVAALSYVYVIPIHPAFEYLFREDAAKEGWIDPNGLERLRAQSMAEIKEPAQPEEDVQEPPRIIGGMVRCLKSVSVGVTIGLLLVAIGGTWAQFRIFRRLAVTSRGPIAPALREVVRHPLLFVAVNVALYGVFFCAMFAGIHFPLASAHISRYIGNEFVRGDLSYIGAAYASGSIVQATAATFVHNYFVATILFTILPSLVVPFSGFIKNFMTFGSVGFVMSPLWTEGIFSLIYHSITMTLELEAYVVASFITILFPAILVKGLLTGNFIRSVGRGILAMVSVAILAAIMLAIAASYEATTLILLR